MFYHITKTENLESIKKHGLLPGSKCKVQGFGCVYLRADYKDRIWLTDDIDYIANHQLGPNYMKDNHLTVIEVDVSMFINDIKARVVKTPDGAVVCPHEFFVIAKKGIKAKNLKFKPFYIKK